MNEPTADQIAMTTPQQPSPAQAPDLMQPAPDKPASDTPGVDAEKRYFTQNPNRTPLFGQDSEIAWVPMRTAAWLERDRNALRAEVERLRADAERLDWLSENLHKISRSPSAFLSKDKEPYCWSDHPTLRDAIDASKEQP